MRAWEFPVPLDPGSALPRFQQVARAIVRDIQAGRLPPGAALPGSRTLAKSLGLHRNTVLAAYRELEAEGWVTGGHPAIRVAQDLPRPAVPLDPPPGDLPGFPLPGGGRLPPWKAPAPAPFDLARGLPDLRLLPLELLGRALRRAALRSAHLGYGDPAGHPALRRGLAGLLAEVRGLPCDPERLMITAGSQQALALVAGALLEPGDRVGVEVPGYPPAWAVLHALGTIPVPVPVDAEGIQVERLEALHAQAPLKAVYLTPHHQFPTTVTLGPGRRMRLMAWAQAQRVALVEDDYDFEFHFEGSPVAPLASADPAGMVVYLGTLSKVLAPGLRLGFIAGAPGLISRLAGLRWVQDHHGPQVVQAAVAELLEDGLLQRHVRRMRRVYLERRTALAAALRRELGGALDFHPAPGALSFWAGTAPGIDADAWAARALEAGVRVAPGSAFHPGGRPLPALRLGFSALDPEELQEAVRRLKEAL